MFFFRSFKIVVTAEVIRLRYTSRVYFSQAILLLCSGAQSLDVRWESYWQ